MKDYGIHSGSTMTPVNMSLNRPTLRIGARGDVVRELQTLLTSWGYLSPSPIDGIFGPQTQNAVMAFQRDQGLTVDGIVGPITWNALLSGNAVTPPPVTPPSWFEYTVQRGDSLWLISQRFGTTVAAIQSLNGLSGDLILPGQILRIPDGTGTAPPPVTPPPSFEYTVRSGDSLWLLAQRFGTTVDAIKSLNGLTGDLILVGQTLRIPGEETTGPAPPPPVNRPTLRLGSRGEDVMVLQAQLSFWLFLPGPIDGIFGPLTQSAVMAFQRDRGLVADGIVGPLTWNALFSGMPWDDV